MAQANAEDGLPILRTSIHQLVRDVLRCCRRRWRVPSDGVNPATLETIDRAVPFASTKTTAIPGILASDVILEAVQWLWENYIPLGKGTIFDGDPGEVVFLPRLAPAACRTRPQGSTNRQFPAISSTWPPQSVPCSCQQRRCTKESVQRGLIVPPVQRVANRLRSQDFREQGGLE